MATYEATVGIGNLVRIPMRGNEIFLVLERNMEPWDAERFDNSSKLAGWRLLEIVTGRGVLSTGRHLEVFSECR